MRTIHRFLWAFLSAIPLYITPLRARAEPPANRWYGWQTLTVAGGSTLFLGTTAVLDAAKAEPAVTFGGFVASFSGFALGGPIVHWAHGNVGKGFASLGINTLLLGTGFVLGFLAGGGREGNGDVGIYVGSGISASAAIAIDVSLLAFDRRKPADNNASVWERRPIALLPTLDIRKDRASLGIMGAF